jgi:HPt (histidine-containing phosphotransfer) domain-containing protein
MDSASAKSGATKALLAQLWQRNRPLLLQRLETIDAAAAAALTGTLTGELRAQAFANAHNLSGSLGMFGYTDGTLIAREIEALLEALPVQNPQRLDELSKALRSTLFPITTQNS